jgi:hypothetical protein
VCDQAARVIDVAVSPSHSKISVVVFPNLPATFHPIAGRSLRSVPNAGAIGVREDGLSKPSRLAMRL